MNRVIDRPSARRSRRPADTTAPGVSVLRWPSGGGAEGVFEMFGAQEAGRFASLEGESPDAAWRQENVLLVSASRRVAPDTPAVQLSLVNTSPSQAVKLSIKLAGRAPRSMSGTVLTAPAMGPHQGFDASNAARPVPFAGAVLNDRVVAITVPARSVVVLTFR
jgi:alpha-N-arabinofuranosidase